MNDNSPVPWLVPALFNAILKGEKASPPAPGPVAHLPAGCSGAAPEPQGDYHGRVWGGEQALPRGVSVAADFSIAHRHAASA